MNECTRMHKLPDFKEVGMTQPPSLQLFFDNGVQPKLKDNKTCTVSINVIKVMLVS